MTCSKSEEVLKHIKHVIDTYKCGSYKISSGKDEIDIRNQIYDVSIILGIIENYINQVI